MKWNLLQRIDRDWVIFTPIALLLEVFLWYLLGFTVEFSIYSFAFLFALVLAFIDWKTHLIPNKYMMATALMGILILPVNPFVTFASAALGVLIVGGLLFLASRGTRGQIGMGDAKLFAVLGLIFGLKASFMILLYALVVSGLLGLILIVFRRVTRKTALPFAPFVLLAMMTELLLKF